eukprot:6177243-Pleurochrysis_carterae.AAC.2
MRVKSRGCQSRSVASSASSCAASFFDSVRTAKRRATRTDTQRCKHGHAKSGGLDREGALLDRWKRASDSSRQWRARRPVSAAVR